MLAIDLNKTLFETNDELKEYVITLAYSYACKINALEQEIYEKSRKDKEKDFFPEYKERYLPIFTAYYTDKT